MSTNYPGSLDTSTQLPQPSAGSFTNSPSHAGAHDNLSLAAIAIETKLGSGASTPSSTNLLVSTGTGTSAWSKLAPVGSIIGNTDTQTLTNKTLTSPTINGGTLDNATVTVDSVAGHTTSNTGTIYGISITTGQIATASSILPAALATGVSAAKFSNPYKFSVYRAAALNSANTFTAVAMDTKLYDTGTNVDVVTNKGRFTAPIAGTYHFSGSAGNSAASGTAIHAKLYKNGAAAKGGAYNGAGTSTGWISHVSGDLLLAVNDYVELCFIGGSGSAMLVGADLCFFDGFLVSVT